MVLALTLQTDIKSIGAYAGFAAIIGLALLVILYFAQAREMRRMADRLEEQEDRLRRVPQPAALTVARPVAVAQPSMAVRPVGPLAPSPVPAAPATATVAIPGARRVSVVAAAAAGTPAGEAAAPTVVSPGDAVTAATAEPVAATPPEAPDPAATQAAGEPKPQPRVPPAPLSPPAPVSPPAVVGPATAAGAMASGADASAEAVAAVPGARRVSLAELTGEEPPTPDPEDTTVVAKPSPARPLVARAAATAEPVGGAQALGGEEAKDAEGPDTSESGVVAIAAPAEPERAADTAPPAWEEPEPSDEPPASARGSSAPGRERGNRASHDEPPVLAPATAAGSRPRYPPPPPVAAGRADPVGATARVSASAAAGGGGATLRRDRRNGTDEGADGPGGSSSGSTLRLVIIAVVLVGVIVLVASQLLSGGSTPSPGSTTTTHTGSGPVPSSVTVAVLNGTTEGGLATRVAGTLASEGYRRGAVANAPSQNHTSTVVAYTPGNRDAAIEVALALALTTTQVVPADAATEAAATQSGASPTVVVTLGSNYAQQ